MTRWANENAYDAWVEDAHRAFPIIPLSVIKAVIATESGFNEKAYLEEAGGDGSVGLMQIRPSTARGVGYGGTQGNLFRPDVNLYYGTAFLAKLAKGTVPMIQTPSGPNYDYLGVVSAYNGGYRPNLGFGARVTKPTTVCLRKDPATGKCLRSFTAQPGQFGNQEHVDRFHAAWRYFGSGEQGGASAGVVGLALAIAAGTLLLTR